MSAHIPDAELAMPHESGKVFFVITSKCLFDPTCLRILSNWLSIFLSSTGSFDLLKKIWSSLPSINRTVVSESEPDKVIERELPAGHCMDLDCLPQYFRNAILEGAVAV